MYQPMPMGYVPMASSGLAGMPPGATPAQIAAQVAYQHALSKQQAQQQSVAAAAAVMAQASKPIPGKVMQQYPLTDKKFHRTCAGEHWEDPTLAEWQEGDYRLFVGDLGNEANDDMLRNAFCKYKSFQRAKVIRDKKTGKNKGFGFLSFGDPLDMARALTEMNGKYVGNRPVKLRKSTWSDRQDTDKLQADQREAKRRKIDNKKGKPKPVR